MTLRLKQIVAIVPSKDTTTAEVTGLGLATSHKIAEWQGGAVIFGSDGRNLAPGRRSCSPSLRLQLEDKLPSPPTRDDAGS
jgi:hypothetical protein